MNKLCLLILLTAMAACANAQTSSDTLKLVSGVTYVFTQVDNTTFNALVYSQSKEDVMVNRKDVGIVYVHKKDIKSVTVFDPKKYAAEKFSKSKIVYVEMGGGYGTHLSLKFSVNSINAKNRTFNVGAFFSTRRDPNCPSNYVRPGLLDADPQEKVFSLGVMYGKLWYLRPGRTRFILKGGLSAGVCIAPVNYRLGTYNYYGTVYTSSSYTGYDNVRSFAPGILFNPTIEFPLRSKSGLSCGVYANINTRSSVIGADVSMLLGKLRNKRPGEREWPLRNRTELKE